MASLFRCTLQDVRITHLVTENNTKEYKRQRKKGKKNIESPFSRGQVSNLNVQCLNQSGAKYRTLPSRNERELNAMAQKCYVLPEKLATPSP